jgi:hypothetical protein
MSVNVGVYVFIYVCVCRYVCTYALQCCHTHFPITSVSFPSQPHVSTSVLMTKSSTSSPGSNDEIFLSSKNVQNRSGTLQTSCWVRRGIFNISLTQEITRYIRHILRKLVLSQQINIQYHENPSSVSWVAPCGQTDKDMPKLMAVFRNFSNAPKKAEISKTTIPYTLLW